MRQIRTFVLVVMYITAAVFGLVIPVRAEELENLKREIEERNIQIQRLEEEARRFREEIAERQEQARTLRGELGRIDRLIAQLRREVALSERKISAKELEIGTLAVEIGDKRLAIENLQAGTGAIIRVLAEREQEPALVLLVKYRRLSEFFRQVDYSAALKEKMLKSIGELRDLRSELEAKKTEAQTRKEELEDLHAELRERRGIQEGEKRARNELLVITKNQEKKYQDLLQDREAKRIALEQEIRAIEEKIRITVDPALLPSTGRGVLGPPLPRVALGGCIKNNKQDPSTNCLTQYFGYTSFATVGGYNGKGHNGVDFRAEVGTPVFAADQGVVTATGDTDAGCRGASYGKWTLLRHPNNLSTLYAHLSSIGVAAGQAVGRGERIGYSGISGYATGPHLHLSVFATQAVRIENIRSRVCGTTMTVPLAAISGYLNPLDYL